MHVELREATRRKGPEKMHRCDVCSKAFPRPSALRTHMNSHNNVRPYTCGFPDCPKTFSVRSNARRHYRTHREEPQPRDSSSHYKLNWVEHIGIPQQPSPPTRSLSQAPFRVRWVPNNISANTRSRLKKPLENDASPSGQANNILGQKIQPSMFLYDPIPSARSPTTEDHDTAY
ncbi:hypothetical protein B0H14DRAFT_2375582 [Mycena olivaceomarginata]|nr:hypothetical protein B0H14DRAFT_2375582 [Mycena olivaceomarginata]